MSRCACNDIVERRTFLNHQIIFGLGHSKLKPFGEDQTRKWMLGYVQKDKGLSHYRFCSHGFSESECVEAYTYYQENKLSDDLKDRRVFSMRHAAPSSYKFYQQHLSPLPCDKLRTMPFMMNSGKWRFTDTFNSCNRSRLYFNAIWKCMFCYEAVTYRDIYDIVCVNETPRLRAIRLSATDDIFKDDVSAHAR